MKKSSKVKGVKRAFGAKKIIALVGCLAAAVVGVGLIYLYNVLSSVNYKYVENTSTDNASNVTSSGSMNTNLASNELLNDPQILNIMLFGEDHPYSGDEHGRSDTMIMLSIDNRHKKLKMTSFLRDLYVVIPGHGQDKLNAAYTLGGPSLSIQTIETNFGIKIDRYAVVDFNAFKDIIDILGGVDIELTSEEIAYINWQSYLNGQTEERHELPEVAGVTHLNGRQALWYARDRGYEDEEHPEVVIPGNDFERTSRQRKLLETILDEFREADLGQIVQIVSKIGPMITTNLKKDEITALVANSMTYLKYDFAEYRVPEDELFEYGWTDDRQSIVVVTDWYQQRKNLALFVFESSVQGS
ncbi:MULTISPECIES: LCP family protein [unclassified Ruminococcus]|uniref:LCP family protein n=1 Tax=unclassified Ruminococcus TaxID=2608920 RepID=UPI00210D073D|nr:MULTISPECIES: LCP family protein [unclassified Ruminococcus]MCQ4023181.1 LytR family transcriptional regulator [Ruminococcus sp. zg-924]MCQ4115399.1 LytR family transcriptional regulator [Ruminococcus sp. zg-921]